MRSQYRRPRTSLTASAIPSVPPASWYENPNLTAPTAITVTDDGKIFGHLAPWGTCHTGFRDSCVTAPKSTTDYAYFTIGSTAVECDDCDDKKVSEVRTGVITLGTLHAGQKLNGRAALSHYENTGAAVADVAAGEDTHGIWIAGALRPTVTEKEMRELRGAALSGDWRRINGNLELVAALAVNTPGFPVIRASAFVAEDGEQMSLVAAGALVAKPEEKLDEPISIFDKLKQSLAYGYDKPKKKKKEMASENLVSKITLAFNPDQERDENGRWTSGGGGNDGLPPSEYEKWAKENGDFVPGADLSRRDLSGINLAGRDLNGANLQSANLYDADLHDADLFKADVSWANLKDANLRQANLNSADLHDANLIGANMQDADLAVADLTTATLNNADLTGADMAGANLRGARAQEADMRGADLYVANLRDTNLFGSDLRDANLSGADMTDAYLKNANLNGANLNGAELNKTDFSNANLENADLRNTVLNNTQFSGANITNADFEGATFSGTNVTEEQLATAKNLPPSLLDEIARDRQMSLIGKITLAFNPDQERDENGRWASGGGDSAQDKSSGGKVDISEIKPGAQLRDGNLSDMVLVGKNLSESNLIEADLRGVNARQVDFVEAHLDGATLAFGDFSGSDMSGAGMSDANLKSANFTDAKLGGNNLTGATANGANFTNAYMEAVNLTNADLTNVDFKNANLGGANFTDANLEGTNFRGADLSGVNMSGVKNLNASVNEAADNDGMQGTPASFSEASDSSPAKEMSLISKIALAFNPNQERKA